MPLHRGVYKRCKRVCTENWLWEKIPCRIMESNPSQYCTRLFGPTPLQWAVWLLYVLHIHVMSESLPCIPFRCQQMCDAFCVTGAAWWRNKVCTVRAVSSGCLFLKRPCILLYLFVPSISSASVFWVYWPLLFFFFFFFSDHQFCLLYARLNFRLMNFSFCLFGWGKFVVLLICVINLYMPQMQYYCMHAYLVCIYCVLYTLWTCSVWCHVGDDDIYIYVLLQVLFILLSQFLYCFI